jgi:hypothetical protein
MPDENNEKTLKAAFRGYGRIFRWGSGLLGKSAIVVGPPIALIVIVAWSFHSDWMKLVAMGLAVVTFFGWYFPFLKFCDKHPAEALLDGTQWAEHHQMLLGVKGRDSVPSENTVNTVQITPSAASSSMPAERNGGLTK